MPPYLPDGTPNPDYLKSLTAAGDAFARQIDQQNQQATMFQGSPERSSGDSSAYPQGSFNPAGGTPSEDETIPGFAQHDPSGFAPFLSHLHEQGRLRTGLYTQDIRLPGGQVIHAKGKAPGELQDLGHDVYLGLSPEERDQWVKRENNQDLSDSATAKLGQYGDNPQSGFTPGSMDNSNDLSTRGRIGGKHFDTSGQRIDGGAVGTNPSYSNHQPDAIPTGQRYTGVGLDSLPNVTQPGDGFQPRPMGNANDVARYGPRMTLQAPVASSTPIPFQNSATLRPAYIQPAVQPSLVPHPGFTQPVTQLVPRGIPPTGTPLAGFDRTQYQVDRAGQEDAAANGTRFLSTPVDRSAPAWYPPTNPSPAMIQNLAAGRTSLMPNPALAGLRPLPGVGISPNTPVQMGSGRNSSWLPADVASTMPNYRQSQPPPAYATIPAPARAMASVR